jgi:4-hydroxyphenylpyruvate dioxygenase
MSHQNEALLMKPLETAAISKIHHIECYVSNVPQAVHYYVTALGFQPVGRTGLETGLKDRASVILAQGDIHLIVTGALTPDSAVAYHVNLHGDGVKDVALSVGDAEECFQRAVARGARPISEPVRVADDQGLVVKATVASCGDLVHTFVEREGYESSFLPGFQPIQNQMPCDASGLIDIDHVALSVNTGELDDVVGFYENVFGFHQSHREDVRTKHTAMRSAVVQNSCGSVKFPITEPQISEKQSQIAEYLKFHHGPGAQHIAFLTPDMKATILDLRRRGVQFLSIPQAYYEMLGGRVGDIEIDREVLRDLGILVDRDSFGYLLQIFTKPIQTRPTLFVEIIQRIGACGFGGGNIRALFEAVEREQASRGTL